MRWAVLYNVLHLQQLVAEGVYVYYIHMHITYIYIFLYIYHIYIYIYIYIYAYIYNVLHLHGIARRDIWSTNKTLRSRVWSLLLPSIYLLKRECTHITYVYRYISEYQSICRRPNVTQSSRVCLCSLSIYLLCVCDTYLYEYLNHQLYHNK